jgi:AAA15 family ATPase/GTPase
MRLTRFSITGFRSYQTSQVLDIDSNITVLAGRNNVGKTALLHALHLPVQPVPGLVRLTKLLQTALSAQSSLILRRLLDTPHLPRTTQGPPGVLC